ncbi:HD domain-containing protein [Lentzea sp. NPDC055074]
MVLVVSIRLMRKRCSVAQMQLMSWARSLVDDMLQASLPRRWRHVNGVAKRVGVAEALLSSQDAEMLRAAALLHDIGYAPELAATGFHPLDGASFLRDQGAPTRLCALVAHHSCAFREAELRGLSAELTEWVDEEGVLRDALWWADMTTSPDGEPTNLNDRIEEIQKRYGPESLVTLFIREARPELAGAVVRTEERLRVAGLDQTAK